MKIFLSWAGEQSKHIAQTLNTWLPQVIQSLEPWFSPRISKGDAWDGAIAEGLDQTPIGIIVLTPESLESKYLHYEAGAIANVKGAKACTLLIGLKPSEVKQPLGRFQHTKAEYNDVLALLKTINEKLTEVGEKPLAEDKLIKSFDLNWPELKDSIEKMPEDHQMLKKRTSEDMLEEVLSLVRSGFDKLNNGKPAERPLTSLPFLPDAVIKNDVGEFFRINNIQSDFISHLDDVGRFVKSRYPDFRLPKNKVEAILFDMDLNAI